MTPRWFAGLMTGTVLDGRSIVALIRTDGREIVEFGPAGMVPYPATMLRDQPCRMRRGGGSMGFRRARAGRYSASWKRRDVTMASRMPS